MKDKVLGIVGAVVLLGIVGAGAWWLMLQIPPNVARLWALTVSVALPLATWAGWWFGHTEERGRLTGFDKAVDRMFGGLSKASGLSSNHTRRMQATREPPIIVLPDVEIVSRQLSGGGAVIEL